MIEFNDTTTAINNERFSIYTYKVVEQEDISIDNSYIFMEGLCSEGGITSQYDLIVIGNIQADTIIAKRDLIVFGDINANKLLVEGQLIVMNKIECKEIELYGESKAGEVLSDYLTSKNNLLVSGSVDSSAEINFNKYLVSFEGIDTKNLNGYLVIANDYVDSDNNQCEHTIIIDEVGNLESRENNEVFDYTDYNVEKIGELNEIERGKVYQITKKALETDEHMHQIFKELSYDQLMKVHKSLYGISNQVDYYIECIVEIKELIANAENKASSIISILEQIYDMPLRIIEYKAINDFIAELFRKCTENNQLKIDLTGYDDWSKLFYHINKNSDILGEDKYNELLKSMLIMFGVNKKLTDYKVEGWNSNE